MGLLNGFVMNMVCCEGCLFRKWSVMNGSVMNRSVVHGYVMDVVCFEWTVTGP